MTFIYVVICYDDDIIYIFNFNIHNLIEDIYYYGFGAQSR